MRTNTLSKSELILSIGRDTFLGWGLTFSRYNSRMGSDNLQEWGLTLFSGRVVGAKLILQELGLILSRDRDSTGIGTDTF